MVTVGVVVVVRCCEWRSRHCWWWCYRGGGRCGRRRGYCLDPVGNSIYGKMGIWAEMVLVVVSTVDGTTTQAFWVVS